MDEYFDYFLSKMGPQTEKILPTQSDIEKFSNLLPNKLLDYWNAYGWGGFHNGLFWIVNPDEFSPVVEAWLNGTDIKNKDGYLAIARTAFGRTFLWNKKTGQNITINPHQSLIITSPPDEYVANGNDTKSLQAFFSSTKPDSLDIDDTKDKKIFKRALKKLGPVASDEMYGFEPALSIGGLPSLENLVIVKIVPHLVLLEQLGEIEIMHIDVSRYL